MAEKQKIRRLYDNLTLTNRFRENQVGTRSLTKYGERARDRRNYDFQEKFLLEVETV